MREKQAIQKVLNSGKAFRGSYLVVLAYPRSDHTNASRIAVMASRKKVGHAVKRNRLCRLTRESFRHWQNTINQCGPLDIVVIVRKGAAELDNQTWFHYLDEQWEKLIKYYKKQSSV